MNKIVGICLCVKIAIFFCYKNEIFYTIMHTTVIWFDGALFWSASILQIFILAFSLFEYNRRPSLMLLQMRMIYLKLERSNPPRWWIIQLQNWT